MRFHEDKIEAFLNNFEEVKHHIRNFEGNRFLELYQDKNDKRIFFAQLLGMSDNISFNLAHEGYNVTKYVPYAPVKKVLPYLIRRAEENTSMAGQTGRELRMIERELDRRKQRRSSVANPA